jgi:hypothetical protein
MKVGNKEEMDMLISLPKCTKKKEKVIRFFFLNSFRVQVERDKEREKGGLTS